MNERTYVVPSTKTPYSREITVKTLCQMDTVRYTDTVGFNNSLNKLLDEMWQVNDRCNG